MAEIVYEDNLIGVLFQYSIKLTIIIYYINGKISIRKRIVFLNQISWHFAESLQPLLVFSPLFLNLFDIFLVGKCEDGLV
jgi:hypothetical protein